MDFQTFFKHVGTLLKKEDVRFALAGGMVTSLYRKTERLTKDLDFLILAESQTQKKASKIIESMKLKPTILRKADLEGGPHFAIKRKTSEPYMVAGRNEKDSSALGLDFILPAMPWFENALPRAEENKIDFGFGPIPCLTVEDVLISKFFSLKNDYRRFTDLDDIKSVFEAGHKLDLDYLSGQMKKLELTVPRELRDIAPKSLSILSKKIKKK